MEGLNLTKKIRMAGVLMLTALFAIVSEGVAQETTTTFKKIIGAQRIETVRDLEICENGDFLMAGMSTSYSQGDSDVYVLRTDQYGSEVWKKTYGGFNHELMYSVDRTGDGNYILSGFTNSFGAGSYDAYVMKINGKGDVLWSKTYGSANADFAREACPTSDGGYIVTGYSCRDTASNNFDAFLLKIDGSGNQQWMKYYGGSKFESSFSVKQTSDGGYVFYGNTYSSGAGDADFYLVKTDASGAKMWEKVMGGTAHEEGQYVHVNSDGTLMVTGDQQSNTAGDFDVSVKKLDANGSPVWSKLYGGVQKDVSKMVLPTSDGGYIVSAVTRSFGIREPDFWLVKIDGNGKMQWDRTFGGDEHEHCYAVKQTSDGGYIAAGHTDTPPSAGVDVYLVKTDNLGKVAQTVGIAEAAAAGELHVYPNPASDRLMIKMPQGNASAVVRMVNPMGQVVFTRKVMQEGHELTIDLAAYARGIYFIDVMDEKTKVTRKILLQ
jgi:hypothetical protein